MTQEIAEAIHNPSVTPNQAIFLYHLRHTTIEQAFGTLEEGNGKMCALGVGMEAFGIIRNIWLWRDKNPGKPDPVYVHDAYTEIALKLDVSTSDTDDIVTLNDEEGLSFAEIADVFEKWLASDRMMGLHEFWEHNGGKPGAKKAEFLAAWKKAEKKFVKLQEEFAKLNLGDMYTVEDLGNLTADEAWSELH